MKFDIFFSICQTEVDGYTPNEKQMFLNFFDQLELADQLGFGVGWVAETHLSCQVQKENPSAVIPQFKGEIGLNTDIFQLAHLVFSRTKNIEVGSAIRNIQCNGGPIAHAEATKTFLTMHGLREGETRKINVGFAAGRFPFSNRPYGIMARNSAEEAGWPVIRNKVFEQATETYLRLLNGENLSSSDISPMQVRAKDFRSEEDWYTFRRTWHDVHGESDDVIEVPPMWNFEKVGVLPFEAPMDLLSLTIGSHDPKTQVMANQHRPVGVFNLSITPSAVVEETHKRMQEAYHKDGGPWRRDLMPRTCLIFLDEDADVAKAQAESAWKNYWQAMEGTLDPAKVEQAVQNAIFGNPEQVTSAIKEKYHPEDRLMLWFDFNNHDSEKIKNSMRLFMEKVAPNL